MGKAWFTEYPEISKEFEDLTIINSVFKKGYWTDNNDKIIKNAVIGQKVKFHIETIGIPNNRIVKCEIVDWDRIWNKDDELVAKDVKIYDDKGSVDLVLGLQSRLYIDDEGDEIELYVNCSYGNETIEFPKDDADYLKVNYNKFPLKVHQRSFAPWKKFGDFIHQSILRDAFDGDDRSFSLKDNFIEDQNDDLQTRQRKLKKTNQVTSRLYHKVEFDYYRDDILDNKTMAMCNLTRGHWWILIPNKFNFSKGKKINTRPFHVEKYGGIRSLGYQGVLNMNIEGSDPMVILPPLGEAPDIDWKLNIRLSLNEDKKTLNIKGYVIGKEFPAYEAFIEDSRGTRFFLHTYTPLDEFELTGELIVNWPDYREKVDITLDVDIDSKGFYFKNNIRSALYIYSDLIKEDDYKYITFKNININEWNQKHLNKKTSKDK